MVFVVSWLNFRLLVVLIFLKLIYFFLDRFTHSADQLFALLNYQLDLFLYDHQYLLDLLGFSLVWIASDRIGLTRSITLSEFKSYFFAIFFKLFDFWLQFDNLLGNGMHFIVFRLVFKIFLWTLAIGCWGFDGSGLRCVFFDIIFGCRFLIIVKYHDIDVRFFHGTVIELEINLKL